MHGLDKPWDIGRPQAAFLTLAGAGAIRGRVLDAGCGTGEHALLAASLGLDATGVDLSAGDLAAAEGKARERGLAARFLRRDARELAGLGEVFDTVLDCGLFHLFGGEDLAAYTRGLRAVLAPGGRYLMLALGDQEPDTGWPHRTSRAAIAAALDGGWRIDAIEAATLETTGPAGGAPAWLTTATRT